MPILGEIYFKSCQGGARIETPRSLLSPFVRMGGGKQHPWYRRAFQPRCYRVLPWLLVRLENCGSLRASEVVCAGGGVADTVSAYA